MPRANRHFTAGQVWHITHRCHKREFLLKFARDRRAYVRWLFEARKRYGLCVLNYIVTSNHVHLLVKDGGRGEIASSMQLIAGAIGQDYNRRKSRPGAYWEDRYHATAVEELDHLQRCVSYIDLNMVRAGVVRHPCEWKASGYREIQSTRDRYAIVDTLALARLCGFGDVVAFRSAHRAWVEQALREERQRREPYWTEAIAVGSAVFVERVQRDLGISARYRDVIDVGEAYVLRESATAYTCTLRPENVRLRSKNVGISKGNVWQQMDIAWSDPCRRRPVPRGWRATPAYCGTAPICAASFFIAAMSSCTNRAKAAGLSDAAPSKPRSSKRF